VVRQGNQQYYPRAAVDTIAAVNWSGSGSRYGPLDIGLYLLAVAGLAACLTLVFLGMRAVMDVGGFCAEGGPYVIDTPCPEGVGVILPLAIFGGLGSAAVVGWKGADIGGRFAGLVLLAWPALFISLGWNFLEYAIWPPGPDTGIVWGWLIPGVIFVIMGAFPLLGMLPIRAGGRGSSDSPIALIRARRRLLNDLEQTARSRGQSAQEDIVTRLERLAALRTAGALTEAEFEQAKRTVLDGGGR
jgi:hypothetical protein